MTDIETRDKIIESARILFADFGYEGTSIREIARTANVNVASVNYYFTSKENLFIEILRNGYKECSDHMTILIEKNKGDLESTLVDLLYYFLEKSHDLLTHFKIMMSSQHSHLGSQGTDDGVFGPPGGMVIADVLRREVPHCHAEDLHWALKTLFSHVTHLGLIHTCCLRKNTTIPYSSIPDLEKSVRRVTRMVLAELRHPQHKTSNL
jgi:AcrR family transcriptional regulator